MIKLGKLTNYAIAIMGQMAIEEESVPRSAHYLSEKTGVPEPTVAKILKMLAGGQMVVSARGVTGGYRLARTADEISIGEIIAVMDGPITIVTCVDGHAEHCGMSATCPTRGNWDKVNNALKEALEKVKLSEMVTAPRGAAPVFLKEINVDRT